MSYYNDGSTHKEMMSECFEMIEEILYFSNHEDKFDPAFIESLQNKDFLTPGQMKAVQNIYDKWDVRNTLDYLRACDKED